MQDRLRMRQLKMSEIRGNNGPPEALRFLKFWFPVFVYSGIIFCVSSRPNLAVPVAWPHIDKVVHIFEYLPFGMLTTRAFMKTKPLVDKKGVCIFVFLVTVIYALSDEWHQSFVPGRECSVFDWVSDIIGATLGTLIYLKSRK